MPEAVKAKTNEMPNTQKAALLFIALGQKWATAIMRMLKPEEVRRISFWINQMPYVPQDQVEEVIRSFYHRLQQRTSLGSSGGTDYLFDVLAGIMGESRAQDLIDELAESEESEVFRILKRVDPKQLAAYLKQEQPQTIALMMSYLEPDRAAAIIARFDEERQVEILNRLARMEETDQEVIVAMERSLTSSLGGMASGKRMRKVGGTKHVAEILNNFAHEQEKQVMDALSQADFELAAEIKDLMFVFADIILLDDKSIQAVVKDVDQADLIVALKGATDPVRDKIYNNISKRQADTIQDELAFMGPVKASTVAESQQKIVNIIRKLDEEGKILIQGKGGGDDIIA